MEYYYYIAVVDMLASVCALNGTRYPLFVELVILLPFAFRRRCDIWFRKIFERCWVKVEWPWFSNQGFCRLRIFSIFHHFYHELSLLANKCFCRLLFRSIFFRFDFSTKWCEYFRLTIPSSSWISYFLLFSNICCWATLEITHILAHTNFKRLNAIECRRFDSGKNKMDRSSVKNIPQIKYKCTWEYAHVQHIFYLIKVIFYGINEIEGSKINAWGTLSKKMFRFWHVRRLWIFFRVWLSLNNECSLNLVAK